MLGVFLYLSMCETFVSMFYVVLFNRGVYFPMDYNCKMFWTIAVG